MLTRILTALVGIPVAIFVVTKGGLIFSLAVMFLAMVAWYELAHMAQEHNLHVYKISSGIPVLLLVTAGGFRIPEFFTPILAFGIMAILIEALYEHCQYGEPNWDTHTAISALAVLYVGLLFAHLPLLRNFGTHEYTVCSLHFTQGELCLWMVLLGTWASDTFAYFFGMAFGKHKFCSVSPKKSMEGAAAGFIGSIIVVALIATKALDFTVMQGITMGLGVGFFAPLGDLVESVLKRSFGIKDSGKLFPGHGGVLDRFDSLLFAVPVVYYLLRALI
jgi:phosphatidate cytidylyltransferase